MCDAAIWLIEQQQAARIQPLRLETLHLMFRQRLTVVKTHDDNLMVYAADDIAAEDFERYMQVSAPDVEVTRLART